MLVALISSLVIIVTAYTALLFYLARRVHSAHDKLWRTLEAGETLLKSNFELQAEVRQWKDSHAEALRAVVDKEQELARAVAARKVLEKRHADLAFRVSESAPLDDLTKVLQADLDEVRRLSLPLPPPETTGPTPTEKKVPK